MRPEQSCAELLADSRLVPVQRAAGRVETSQSLAASNFKVTLSFKQTAGCLHPVPGIRSSAQQVEDRLHVVVLTGLHQRRPVIVVAHVQVGARLTTGRQCQPIAPEPSLRSKGSRRSGRRTCTSTWQMSLCPPSAAAWSGVRLLWESILKFGSMPSTGSGAERKALVRSRTRKLDQNNRMRGRGRGSRTTHPA